MITPVTIEPRFEIRQSIRNRALYFFITLTGPPLALALTLIAVAYLAYKGPLEYSIAAMLVLGVVPNTCVSVLATRLGIQTAWFRAYFLIYDDRIEMRLPGNRVKVGLWKDLVSVPSNLGFLGFVDGTYMNMSTLWPKLNEDQIDRILALAGTDSPLPKAWREAKRRNKELLRPSSLIPRVMIIGTIVFVAGTATALILSAVDSLPSDEMSLEAELVWQIALLGPLGICISMASFTTKRVISYIRQEHEFHRDYPS